jgi:hypothetical protein
VFLIYSAGIPQIEQAIKVVHSLDKSNKKLHSHDAKVICKGGGGFL